MIEHIQLYLTRIDLDRHLRIGQEIKVFAQQRHQPADLRFIQVGRRTAAPVHLADLTAGEQRRTAGDLLRQNVQVFVGLVRLARHQLVAAAEVAQLMAERDMHVQRQRPLRVARSGALKRRFVVALVKLQRRGV